MFKVLFKTVYFLDNDGTVLGSGGVPTHNSQMPNVVYYRDNYYKITDMQYANCPAYIPGTKHSVEVVPQGTYQLID